MKIKILMMLKNEDELILPWIKYHGTLIGHENLVILDNGSTSERVISALNYGAAAGALVDYNFNSHADFINKGELYRKMSQEFAIQNQAEFFIPLDCDEFLAVEHSGRVDCSRSALVQELQAHVGSPNPLVIYAGLDNHAYKPGFFRWSPEQRKTFFAAGACAFMDHGYHIGQSRLGLDPIRTKVVYIHYHFKPYDLIVEHSRAKLAPFTADFSDGNMRRYMAEQKPGWHCAAHLLRSREEYERGFDGGPWIEFPEIRAKFNSLGEVLPFS